MNRKIILIAALIFTSLLFSCNEDSTVSWQSYYCSLSSEAFCNNYMNHRRFPFSQPVPLLFSGDSQWDEVTYNITDPSDFKITHYESKNYTTTDSCDSFVVLRDSVEIGNVILRCDGKVLFEEKLTSAEHLLYDFKYICSNSIGVYEINLSLKGYLSFFINYDYLPKDLGKFEIPSNGGSSYPFIEDEYGGYSIALFGSTAGFFSPIEKCKEGYKCEVLQASYKIYSASSIYMEPFYSNRKSVISPFLPDDFWISQ